MLHRLSGKVITWEVKDGAEDDDYSSYDAEVIVLDQASYGLHINGFTI